MSSGLYVESVTYIEKDNFWIGPRQVKQLTGACKSSSKSRLELYILTPSLIRVKWIVGLSLKADLIHLGAKYSPCMRKDANVEKAISDDRTRENETACCVRNDGAGCVQTPRKRCSVSDE